MRIKELLEAIKNPEKYKMLDRLADISDIARNIRQNYNKINKKRNKLTPSEKAVTLLYSEYSLTNRFVQQNPALVSMLNEMIKICKS
jgi:DNA-binding transcriptional ArsR family regulator